MLEHSRRELAIAAPRTILMRGERLAESKRLFASGDERRSSRRSMPCSIAARAALAAPPLIRDAKGSHSAERQQARLHEHGAVFLARIRRLPNGLPFVNRDGEMYPESRKDHDGLRLQQTVTRVHALALAWYLTGDATYAQSAAKHLRVFFLDTATRMNPNLNFAQAVLGVIGGSELRHHRYARHAGARRRAAPARWRAGMDAA